MGGPRVQHNPELGGTWGSGRRRPGPSLPPGLRVWERTLVSAGSRTLVASTRMRTSVVRAETAVTPSRAVRAHSLQVSLMAGQRCTWGARQGGSGGQTPPLCPPGVRCGSPGRRAGPKATPGSPGATGFGGDVGTRHQEAKSGGETGAAHHAHGHPGRPLCDAAVRQDRGAACPPLRCPAWSPAPPSSPAGKAPQLCGQLWADLRGPGHQLPPTCLGPRP